MNPNISIGPAISSDLQAIQSLLASASLPWEDISSHLDDFMVARSQLEIVGCVGLERAGNSGLLRSLAVTQPHRGKGVGNALCRAILKHARHLGTTSVYLLTTTAEPFFKRIGFSRISREDAPLEISQTSEFRGLCPSTALLMTLPFQDNASISN